MQPVQWPRKGRAGILRRVHRRTALALARRCRSASRCAAQSWGSATSSLRTPRHACAHPAQHAAALLMLLLLVVAPAARAQQAGPPATPQPQEAAATANGAPQPLKHVAFEGSALLVFYYS